MWDELLSAIALVLVLEGIFPFISPDLWRAYMRQALELEDQQLRIVGGVCMVAGLVMLYLVR